MCTMLARADHNPVVPVKHEGDVVVFHPIYVKGYYAPAQLRVLHTHSLEVGYSRELLAYRFVKHVFMPFYILRSHPLQIPCGLSEAYHSRIVLQDCPELLGGLQELVRLVCRERHSLASHHERLKPLQQVMLSIKDSSTCGPQHLVA